MDLIDDKKFILRGLSNNIIYTGKFLKKSLERDEISFLEIKNVYEQLIGVQSCLKNFLDPEIDKYFKLVEITPKKRIKAYSLLDLFMKRPFLMEHQGKLLSLKKDEALFKVSQFIAEKKEISEIFKAKIISDGKGKKAYFLQKEDEYSFWLPKSQVKFLIHPL